MNDGALEFERNDGTFSGRQHIVNHVDMILGLGRDFYSSFRKGRLVHAFIPEQGIDYATSVARLSDEELDRGREWLLGQCLYAERWEQLLPIQDGYYLGPSDFRTMEDGMRILHACEDEWVSRDYAGDRDAFWETTSVVVLLAFWDRATCDRIVVRRRPEAKDDEFPAPVNGRAVMGRRHGHSIAWIAFAERICDNEHVRAVLFDRQRGKCAICGQGLDRSTVIHHVDYDHECGLAHLEESWTRPGTRVQPDCGRCHVEHGELFDECTCRLRVVHSSCNYLIEGTL